MTDKIVLRPAKESEVTLIFNYIKKMARYEKLEDKVVGSEETLRHWIFEEKLVKVLFPEVDGKIIGFVLYFFNFSTFEGRAGLYIEDIFIDDKYRARGYGKVIFKELAKIALEKGCSRMEWVCLDWNETAISFYKKMGAFPMDEWTTYRMEVTEIRRLSNEGEEVL